MIVYYNVVWELRLGGFTDSGLQIYVCSFGQRGSLKDPWKIGEPSETKDRAAQEGMHWACGNRQGSMLKTYLEAHGSS